MRIAFAIAVAAGVLAAPRAAAPGFDLQSWPDLDHAWASAGSLLYATSDGGKTWRAIFSGGSEIFRVERTSVSAGIVVTGDQKPVTFWTRDNGKHWYRGIELFSTAVGHGGQLFTAAPSSLVQLKPWPPRGVVRCRGTWWGTAFGPGANTRAPKNVCSVPSAISLQKGAVYTLTKGELAPDTLVSVPGGAASVATDGSARGRPLSIVVYRNGHGTETPLPNTSPPETAFSGLELLVSWPVMRIDAEASGTHVTWTSTDGGDSWAALR
jgi:hypothetical protein